MHIRKLPVALLLALCFSLLSSCSSDKVQLPPTAAGEEYGSGLTVDALPSQHSDLLMLPTDGIQPWERSSSTITPESEFLAGRDFFQSGPAGVTENGEAARLESPTGGTAYAIYRIPMNGQEPGLLSFDVNLLGDSSGVSSPYFAAYADYESGRWIWQGPFRDSHIRLSLPARDLLSAFGNLFVTVLASDGARVDVVGLGTEVRHEGDAEAPPMPQGFVASAVAGGVELTWNPVIAGDLAGYAVYWSTKSFTGKHSAGVRSLGYIEGSTHVVLSGLANRSYIRISALDYNGNESAVSAMLQVDPLPGESIPLLVQVDSTGDLPGDNVTVTASGGDSYDYDLNGDGVFEVSADRTGSFMVDTTHSGLLRPRVRASLTGSEAVALGSVSLFITGNSRPVASAVASPQSGPAPLQVNFAGIGEDAEDPPDELTYAWDFNGDGIYETGTNQSNPPGYLYEESGIFNVKFRVMDSDGAWDVDSVSVMVESSATSNIQPLADLQVNVSTGSAPLNAIFDASLSSDPDGSLIAYAWDWEGDGLFDQISYYPVASHVFTEPGARPVKLRVIDNEQGFGEAAVQVNVYPQSQVLPNAVITVDRTEGFGPYLISFDASESSDSDGQIVSYEWDFDGDGAYDAQGSETSAFHYYNSRGNFSPTLRVTDNGGWQDTAAISLTLPSAWSMFGGDQYNSNRSGHIGPQTNNLLWKVFCGQAVASPVFDYAGNLYIGTNQNGLRAFNPDGSDRWVVDDDYYCNYTVALGTQGCIYFGSSKGLIAFDLSGEIIWQLPSLIGLESSVKVGPDGSIYLGGFGMTCIDPNGYIRWFQDIPFENLSGAAIADNGTLYCGSTTGELFALDSAGQLKWVYDTGEQYLDSPAIGSDGTIYIGSNSQSLHAVNPDGSEKWTYDTGDFIQSTPAIAEDGTVFIGNLHGDLYAINADGTLRWVFDALLPIYSSPLVDSEGTVYFGSNSGNVYAVNPDGTEKWRLDNIGNVESTFALSSAGVLSFLSGSFLCAVGDV